MSYLVSHHGALYFQIRVPAAFRGRFGNLVRTHLQTSDVAIAKALAMRLAGEWLTRFATERELGDEFVAVGSSGSAPGTLTGAVADGDLATGSGTEASVVPAIEPAKLVHSSVAAPKPVDSPLSDHEIFEMWFRSDPTRVRSTVSDFKAALKSLRKTCKKPLVELTRIDLVTFRDRLIQERLSRATVSKRIGIISTLLQTVLDAGLITYNVGRGLKVPRADVPTLDRRAFTSDELRRIFTSPVFNKGYRPVAGCGAACVWMPILALATGARLEEIAQLLTCDIIIDAEHGALMRITDEGEDQRLKTPGSKRTIPLHADALQAGFLDYVESVREGGNAWVFPDLLPDHDGRRGGNFGKWFQRYLRASRGAGIDDPRVVFHSFRHSFKTLCRAAGISEEVHDALTGHVSASVSRQYGEMPMGPLVDAIRKVKLPISLPRDFSGA